MPVSVFKRTVAQADRYRVGGELVGLLGGVLDLRYKDG